MTRTEPARGMRDFLPDDKAIRDGVMARIRDTYATFGYREIECSPGAFIHDLAFSDAVDMIPRLNAVARSHGRQFSVKLSNTLVVKNHKSYFHDELMYLSGAPLHVITMNLVRKFREKLGNAVPVSFSVPGSVPFSATVSVRVNLER